MENTWIKLFQTLGELFCAYWLDWHDSVAHRIKSKKAKSTMYLEKAWIGNTNLQIPHENVLYKF